MANHDLLNIYNDIDVKLLKVSNTTISGEVKDVYGNPVKREVVVYRYPEFTVPYSTMSDQVDGSWSVNVVGSVNDRFIVLALGESSEENAQVYDWVAGG